MSTTYLEVVNKAIDESGSNLDQFAADGSDFTATGLDPLMYKFKTWVARAWQTVQQEAYDWEFMSEQAVVNLEPGTLFYSPHAIDWTADDVNPLTIYDTDGTARVTDQAVTVVQDLTGTYTDQAHYGYIQLDSSNSAPVDFTLKSGGEYFLINTNSQIKIVTSRDMSAYPVGATIESILINTYDPDHILVSSGTYTLTGTVTAVESLDAGVNTLITINYTHIADTFWNDFLTNVPPAFGAAIVLNDDGNILTVSGESPIGARDTCLTPKIFSVDATGNVTVTGGNISTATAISSATVTISAVDYDMTLVGTVNTAVNTTSASFTITSDTTNSIGGTPFFLFTIMATESTDFDSITFTTATRTVDIPQVSGETTTAFTTTVPVSESFKNYIHSWMSYDWSEEADEDDFIEDLAEVDQQSFRIVYHEDPTPSTEIKLSYIPWEQFIFQMDNANQPPGAPRLVTEDNTGRWKFYPALDRPYTILFDYVRNPQTVSAFDDTFKKIPDDLTDVIMWLALIYYGEYNEQPSVQMRAMKHYKDLMFRLQLRFRDKFHFKSAFTFSGWR